MNTFTEQERKVMLMAAFKNKNGTWYAQFRYTDWKGGKQPKLKRGFATKKEAQEWERQFLMQKRADINMTFESFVKLYEKDIRPRLKENTWLNKQCVIESKLLPYFGNRKLCDITPADVIAWQNEIMRQTIVALLEIKYIQFKENFLKREFSTFHLLSNFEVG